MASFADNLEDGEISRLNRESARLEAETRKLMAEAGKLSAEQLKLSTKRAKLDSDLRFSPWLILIQGALAAAALLGTGIGIAKIFLR